jgi:Zn-dependent protease
MQECAFHPGRETLLSCTVCGKDACPECLTQAAVGQHCVGCHQGRPAAGEKGLAAYRVRSAVFGVDENARMRRPSPLFLGLCALFLGICVAAWFAEGYMSSHNDINLARGFSIAIVIVGALLGLAFHEFAHAFVAYRGGDHTVASKGYLTLDLRHYTDPLRSIVLPMAFLLLGGLPLPGGSVWINHSYLRSRHWESAVALAGPAINFVGALALIGLNATGVFHGHEVLGGALIYLAYLEIAIVILNLIPIPGLDGFGVIEPYLPNGLRRSLAPVRQWSTLILMVLILNGSALSFIWTWSYSVMTTLGVSPYLIAIGEFFANPQLF